MPTIAGVYFGFPTIEGKEHLGASSPEKPALQTPDPLSMTTGEFYGHEQK